MLFRSLCLIFGLGPLGLLLVRSNPTTEDLERRGLSDEFTGGTEDVHSRERPAVEFTLRETLYQPAFWALAMGSSLFNLIWSATTLFNESILKERGLPDDTFVGAMAAMTATGLIANLVTGWAATKVSMNRVLSVGLLILAPTLWFYPRLTTSSSALGLGASMGIVGGITTVIFFSAWSRVFGRTHLGQIQGAAQLISVFASALGPLLLTASRQWTGSYAAFFQVSTLVTLACAAWSGTVAAPMLSRSRPVPEPRFLGEDDAVSS